MNFILAVLLAITGFLGGWVVSADYFTALHKAELSKVEASYAKANQEAIAEHQASLTKQLQQAKSAERDFLAKQQTLNKQNQQLKEQLYAISIQPAAIRVHDCVVGAQWMQHYRQALGVARMPTTRADGANTARGADDAAITPAELLHHLTDYGHWCQSNVEQLTALQNSLKGAKL